MFRGLNNKVTEVLSVCNNVLRKYFMKESFLLIELRLPFTCENVLVVIPV